ncbi:IS21-like element helper ATPase IstB [Dehalococcoides mccartyi]|uniref:IS21-like element helper ATPase IstB n=1 Tax=Dehalococcoides mccartyi TaxID=61435 RepID=UPI0002B75E5E|nr:IS21-like element helper ATPase IstB [Dehalococcoides mccartyi]AGG05958.1 IstB-like ATP-binding domain-containing protein [Dehalococcoides mccartyi DCMB5]
MVSDILLRSHLKRLRLPVIAQNYSRLSKEAAANNQSFEDYLLALLEGEVLQRDENAQKLRLARARFPVIKMLDTFDFSSIPSLNKALVIELCRGIFVDRRENVIFIGSYGTGKTHLATALGEAACREGKRVRFYTAAGLVNELLEAHAQLRISRLESALSKCDLIILDELGFVPFSKEGAEALFTFCSSRYERGSLVITTNLDFARWKEIFGDEALTGALLDRLTHRCHIIEMNGDSYRFKESLRRKEKK